MRTSVEATGQDKGAAVLLVCPACGARARRLSARFCATCGRGLQELGYLPTDTLRASYHHQYQQPPLMPGHQPHRTCVARPLPRTPHGVRRSVPYNSATRLARAFVMYALVPYIGAIFCTGAVVFGVVGFLRARRAPPRGNPRAAARCILLGLVIFSAHLFLWWLLLR